MSRAMASDFDGTLYFMRSPEPFRAADILAIRRFQAEGNLFGICSGRSLHGIQASLDGLIRPDFYILASGARVMDGSGQPLFTATVPFDIVRALYDAYHTEALVVFHAGDTVYNISLHFPLQTSIPNISTLEPMPVYGVSFGAKGEEAAQALRQDILARFGGAVDAFVNRDHVDLVPKGCSKGHAIDRLCEGMGISDVAGIGDSYNDIPLLQRCSPSFTFTDAPEAVRQNADHIVPSLADAIRILTESSSFA